MPKTLYDMSASPGESTTRVRNGLELSNKSYALLCTLTDLMRDIHSNERRSQAPRESYLASCIAWAQFSAAGRALIDKINLHNRRARPGEQKDPMKELMAAYAEVLAERYTPGAENEKLQTKYSATYMAGAVLSLLLERHGQVLIAELEERRERSANALLKIAPLAPQAPLQRTA